MCGGTQVLGDVCGRSTFISQGIFRFAGLWLPHCFISRSSVSLCCLGMFLNAACYSNSFDRIHTLVDTVVAMPLSVLWWRPATQLGHFRWFSPLVEVLDTLPARFRPSGKDLTSGHRAHNLFLDMCRRLRRPKESLSRISSFIEKGLYYVEKIFGHSSTCQCGVAHVSYYKD